MSEDVKRPWYRRKWFLVCAAVLILIALGAIGWRALMPYYYAHQAMPAYLEKNQRYFRAERVEPGTFNHLKLTEISLGESNQPLLTAPAGRVYFGYADGQHGALPRLNRLELDRAKLLMSVKEKEIRLNGIPLADFVEKITELPMAPDGSMIPLTVNAEFKLGRAPVTTLRLEIKPGARSGEFLFSGNWHTTGENAENGEWNALYDRNAGTLSVTTADGIAPHFFQEILVRAREPELVASLIQSGLIAGKGAFSATFPELKISDFTYSGTLSKGAFSFQKLALQAEKPFAFELRKSGKLFSWKAPAVELSSPFAIPLVNVVIERKARQPEVTFAADADLRGALGRVLLEQCGMDATSHTPMVRHIAGSIHSRSLVWDFTGTVPEKENTAQELFFEDNAKRSLAIVLNRFAIHGHGKGPQGSVESELGLNSVALTLPEGVFKANRFDLHSTRQLGKNGVHDDHIEFHSNRIFGDTVGGQCEIADLSGAVNIQRPVPAKSEFQWVAHSNTLRLFSKDAELCAQNWQLTSIVLRDADQNHWQLTTLDSQCDKAEIRHKFDRGSFQEPKLHLAGELVHGKIGSAEIRLRAEDFLGRNVKTKQLDGNLLWDGKTDQWQGSLTAGSMEIPVKGERAWFARKLSLSANGSGLSFPEKLLVKAESLAAAWQGWNADFRGGEWNLSCKENDFFCQCSTEAMHIASPRRVNGNGDLGSTKLNVALHLEHGKVSEWTADVESRHPAWSWREVQTSGENGTFALRYRADSAWQYSGSAELRNATLIHAYCSVMAPELSFRSEYSPRFGAKGTLNFAKASIASPDSRLEFSDASCHLPWSFAPDADAAAPVHGPGKLIAEEVAFDGENQGTFSAELVQKNSLLSYQGTLKTRYFGGTLLALTGEANLPPAAPRLTAKMDLPLSELSEPWAPGRWFPALSGSTALKGRFAFGITLELENAKRAAAAVVMTENSDWKIDNAVLEGVSAQAEFSDLLALSTRAAFPVTARRFFWKGYELRDNRATLTFLPEGKLSLAAWRADYGSGSAELAEPVEFSCRKNADDETPADVKLSFNVEKIPLADLLHKLGLSAVESDAAVSGKVRTVYRAGRLHFGESQVGFRTPAGEVLRMNDIEGAIIRMKDPVYQAFIQAVLREVRCSSGVFDFTEDGRELVMKIKADGRPVHPVPFVYQGSSAKALFRPTEPGEAGFDGEIQLSVKLKLSAPAYRMR